MTPKEKARELVEKFKPHVIFTLTDGTLSEYIKIKCAKECALIAVDEILHVISYEYNKDMGSRGFDKYLLETLTEWQQVKEEINKI